MKVQEFLNIMNKVQSFKKKLNREGITQQTQNIILKIYITELTEKININFLEVI